MRSALPELARELGADERTLRRAAERGTLRCARSRPRHLELAANERAYLRLHWPLLHDLTGALRTEPNIGLAVLYGSKARGDGNPGSDIDILVAFRRPDAGAGARLGQRLESALGLRVDVAVLDHVRATSPQLLEHAVRDGRVLVDRDRHWAALSSGRPALRRAATRARRRAREEAAEAFATLTEA